MPTILDATGVSVSRSEGSKSTGKQKSQTWLAGVSTPVGESPSGKYKEYYSALARVADAVDELNAGNNTGFTAKARPVQEDIIIGLDPQNPQFYLATPDMLTADAKKKLGVKPKAAEPSK